MAQQQALQPMPVDDYEILGTILGPLVGNRGGVTWANVVNVSYGLCESICCSNVVLALRELWIQCPRYERSHVQVYAPRWNVVAIPTMDVCEEGIQFSQG